MSETQRCRGLASSRSIEVCAAAWLVLCEGPGGRTGRDYHGGTRAGSPSLARGLLAATRVRGDIGRPYYVYSLTPKAQELFPKDYASLAQLLLEETLTLHGPEGLRSLLNSVSRRMAEKLLDQTQGKRAFAETARTGSLAWRDRHGSLDALRCEAHEGDYMLKAHTCPYFEVATQPSRNLRHGTGNDGRTAWAGRQMSSFPTA